MKKTVPKINPFLWLCQIFGKQSRSTCGGLNISPEDDGAKNHKTTTLLALALPKTNIFAPENGWLEDEISY